MTTPFQPSATHPAYPSGGAFTMPNQIAGVPPSGDPLCAFSLRYVEYFLISGVVTIPSDATPQLAARLLADAKSRGWPVAQTQATGGTALLSGPSPIGSTAGH